MKRHFSIVMLLLFVGVLSAQVHISIDEPDSTWTVQKALGSYVGQTVIFDDPIVVCSNASSGSLSVAPWRAFNPESQGVVESDAYATAVHVNNTCRFTLTGVSGYHRCGEKIYNLKVTVNSTSSVSWQSGEWRGNTRADLQNLPDLGDYRLLVCGFNLENYFVRNLGSKYLGANSYSEHQDQRAKVSKALKQINADIFGLVELEEGDDAIKEIVNDLNSNLPGRNYKYFHDASTGSNQKSDYVYDANKVEAIGTPSEINTELQHRKKMICFKEIATGEKFIYSINHFKSMNTGDEERRVNEATAVLNFYKSYRQNTSIRDNDILFMGDMNCYAFTDPIMVFTNYGMFDLHRTFHADSSYSYMFGGLASYIDHALCSPSLLPQVTGMAGYHINSDENDSYRYDGNKSDETMFRCSDHDPVLVGLKLDKTAIYDPKPTVNTRDIIEGKAENLIITEARTAGGQESFYAIYDISGRPVSSGTIQKSAQEVQLPHAPGVYILYIYFETKIYPYKFIIH